MDGPTRVRDFMKRSYLIQRLERPFVDSKGKVSPLSPFSFGCIVNGGLSKEASRVLSQIMQFDYMGAAEFEWGAVPQTFKFLVEQKEAKALVCDEIEVDGVNGKMKVYLICPTSYEKEVKRRVMLLAQKNIPREMETKEHVGLSEWTFPNEYRVRRDPEYRPRVVGWLEIDNGFMFFVDHMMYTKCKILFGLE